MAKGLSRVIVAFFAVTIFCGCASNARVMSQSELKTTAARTIPGVTKKQVIAATHELWRLADGSDFTIADTEYGVGARRFWQVYVVLATWAGVDFWRVKATEDNGATTVSMEISTKAAPMIFSLGEPGQTELGDQYGGNAIYNLYFSRLEFLLGKRETWTDCTQAKAKIRTGEWWGDVDPLCHSLNTNDHRPI